MTEFDVQYLQGAVERVHKLNPRVFGRPFHFANELRDPGALDAALGLLRQRWYTTDQQRAAALFRSIIANHPFIDGNKRVAVIAVAAYAGRSFGALDATYDDLRSFALTVASGEPDATDLERVTAWFEAHWVAGMSSSIDEQRQEADVGAS